MEYDLNGRRLQWKMTSIKEDHNGRRPQWKTTSMKDNLNGRQPQLKTTLMEDNLDGRQPMESFESLVHSAESQLVLADCIDCRIIYLVKMFKIL